jgi:hypothetical protein
VQLHSGESKAEGSSQRASRKSVGLAWKHKNGAKDKARSRTKSKTPNTEITQESQVLGAWGLPLSPTISLPPAASQLDAPPRPPPPLPVLLLLLPATIAAAQSPNRASAAAIRMPIINQTPVSLEHPACPHDGEKMEQSREGKIGES